MPRLETTYETPHLSDNLGQTTHTEEKTELGDHARETSLRAVGGHRGLPREVVGESGGRRETTEDDMSPRG